MPDTTPPTARASALLKFQIGPVQDFIAQARSTRDLWSGSYLLSWLVAAGIKALPQGAELIFPNRASRQPLLNHPLKPEADGILVPNLPNIFIARIAGDADTAAGLIKKGIEAEWLRIAQAVWKQHDKIGLAPTEAAEKRFFAQVDRHLSISWQTTPLADDSPASYLSAYRLNGWHLDAVRQTRDFQAWDSATDLYEKDSLSGKAEALVGGTEYQKKMEALKLASKGTIGEAYASLFAKHADYLGAVAIIKRCWHLAYLNSAHIPKLRTGSADFTIRSIPAIAARTDESDDDALPQEKAPGDKYIAAIAFDGDSIGRWVNGDYLTDSKSTLKQHHSDFSEALSNFAVGEVRKIVERIVDSRDQYNNPIKVPLGQLIYAGGDDVVCLVPADAALSVAAELRKAFQEATANTASIGVKPDASAGIAIAHIHSPLQDLIREAQKAEKRAKTTVGRPAFSITLMKRNGEISYWGSKWESKGLELYRAIAERLRPDGLSAKFPHRVCQLLTPYLTQNAGLSRQQDAITDMGIVKDLITREFAHTAERQGSARLADELKKPLSNYLAGILTARAERETTTGKPASQTVTQELLTSVIDLCTTVAFADRTKPAPAEKQPAE